MFKNLFMVIVMSAVMASSALAADLSGGFEATYSLGDSEGTATWTGTQIKTSPIYRFESSTGVTWKAITLGDYAIWQIQEGAFPIYFGKFSLDESGVLTGSGVILATDVTIAFGSWTATKVVGATPPEGPGTIDEAGNPFGS